MNSYLVIVSVLALTAVAAAKCPRPKQCHLACPFGYDVTHFGNCSGQCACAENHNCGKTRSACAIACRYGYTLDGSGCHQCQCNKPKQCVENTCNVPCRYGFDEDVYGCEICRCRQQPKSCSNAVCFKECGKRGFARDPNGCLQCRCDGDVTNNEVNPTTPATCPNHSCQMYCQYGFVTDLNGCPVCKCRQQPAGCRAAVCYKECGKKGFQRNTQGCLQCKCASETAADATATTPTCPTFNCQMYCRYGFLNDSNGCSLCRCRIQPAHCSKQMCLIACGRSGFARDQNGCVLCKCARWKATTPAVIKAACPRVMCAMHCVYGFEKDSDGCSQCKCRKQPDSCAAVVCFKECGKEGFQRDFKGCLQCRCASQTKTKTSSPCSAIATCMKLCSYGFKKDMKGCPICQCRTQEPFCTAPKCDQNCDYPMLKTTTKCFQCTCSPKPSTHCYDATESNVLDNICHIRCPYGYKIDSTGCLSCKCKRRPCEGVVCVDNRVCVDHCSGKTCKSKCIKQTAYQRCLASQTANLQTGCENAAVKYFFDRTQGTCAPLLNACEVNNAGSLFETMSACQAFCQVHSNQLQLEVNTLCNSDITAVSKEEFNAIFKKRLLNANLAITYTLHNDNRLKLKVRVSRKFVDAVSVWTTKVLQGSDFFHINDVRCKVVAVKTASVTAPLPELFEKSKVKPEIKDESKTSNKDKELMDEQKKHPLPLYYNQMYLVVAIVIVGAIALLALLLPWVRRCKSNGRPLSQTDAEKLFTYLKERK